MRGSAVFLCISSSRFCPIYKKKVMREELHLVCRCKLGVILSLLTTSLEAQAYRWQKSMTAVSHLSSMACFTATMQLCWLMDRHDPQHTCVKNAHSNSLHEIDLLSI